ncbi:DUF7657 domain-containing protein [Aeromicrobium wangtongii]|uniref:Glycosyltransferase RgtA/B/C/D-like domain-containing protein n=1 Tax=Aeromicrobium wangtongii TaxID=2969247 RepID=A0ABY5M702_9ACTN|nr:hypothetical protein [Aeromicrobium wangtongii]UUP13935.1 hypothetical protein NQV15_01085 [Aeromicrobium wangtongii]
MLTRTRFDQMVEPAPDGLPNRRVVLVPLLLLFLLFAGLVGAGISGTSSGEFQKAFSSGDDSRLVLGASRDIRSDEWFVQTPWTISQVEQGLPRTNGTFPGGMDSTVQHDMPSKDWSTAFRPHLWGFFALPLDQAMAFKWWLPGFSMIAAGFLFMVTLLPRRPIGSMAMAVGFFFAPFFQWWSLSITYWPVAWALVTMAAVVWLLKRPRSKPAWVLSALSGYLVITTGTGVYVPFIVPAGLAVVFFAVGAVLQGGRSEGSTVRQRLLRLWPLVAAGGVAVIVMGVWAATRWKTIELFTGTVYPGARLEPPGGAQSWYAVRSVFGAVAAKDWLNDDAVALLGVNRSEASSFFLPGLFIIPVLLWLLVHRWRSRRQVDWVVLGSLMALTLFLAYLFLPGWDPLAHLLFLDRSTPTRMRLGLGLVSLLLVVVAAWRVDQLRRADATTRVPWLIVIGSAALAAAANISLLVYLGKDGGSPYSPSTVVVLVAAAYVLVVAFLARGWFTAGALVFLALSMVSAAWVNPVYRGVYDLNDTKIVKTAKALDPDREGTWVGVGMHSGAALVESGLTGYSGFQSAPPPLMWSQIDPEGRYEQLWNRLALVLWYGGEGEPVPTNPGLDQIHVNFDSCSDFAQKHVTNVLSEAPLDQRCLRLVETVKQGKLQFWIYDVTKRDPA